MPHSLSRSSNGAQDRAMMLEIPQNLHGLFLVESLQINPDVDGYVVVALVVCRICFFILVSYFTQATYIVRLHALSREMDNGCSNDLHLQVTCMFVLAAAGFQELREVFHTASLLYWLPDWKDDTYAPMSLQQGEVFNVEAQGFRAALWKMAERHHTGKKPLSKTWKLQAASRVWKAICVCVIVIPRLLICVALLCFASGFLVRSHEKDMIVDTVAALFVLEIGGFIFKAFITNEVQQQLAAMEGTTVVTNHVHRMATFVSVQFLYPLVCVGFAVGRAYYLRQECADEKSFFSLLMSFESWKAMFDCDKDQ